MAFVSYDMFEDMKYAYNLGPQECSQLSRILLTVALRAKNEKVGARSSGSTIG